MMSRQFLNTRKPNANGVTPHSPGSRYSAHPGSRYSAHPGSRAPASPNPNGVAQAAVTTFHPHRPIAPSGATPLGLSRLFAWLPRVRGVPRPWAMELNAVGVGLLVLLLSLSLPPSLRADDL